MEILYLTYDGLLDPLGSSQILPYLFGLQKRGFSFHVISFEKSGRFFSAERVALQQQLKKNHIRWYPLLYHKRLSALATLYDVLHGVWVGRKVMQNAHITVLHARSYVASLIALTIKQRKKFLFDMRGFWPEERVEGGIWSRNSPLFAIAKYFEKKFFAGADHVVVLTHTAKRILEQQYKVEKPISVIPTCVDTSLFKPRKKDPTTVQELGIQGKFVLSYVGSLGTWYCFEEMVKFFKVLNKQLLNAHFLLLVNDTEQAKQRLRQQGLPPESYTLRSVHHEEMPKWLSLADTTLFFIKPVFSKKGSCPTKLGESLATGTPLIANTGIGDCDRIIERYNVGLLVTQFTDHAYRETASRIKKLSGAGVRQRCRTLALASFSLDGAISAYNGIYRQIEKNRKKNEPL